MKAGVCQYQPSLFKKKDEKHDTLAIIKNYNFLTDIQTDTQTEMVTPWPTWPTGPSRWKRKKSYPTVCHLGYIKLRISIRMHVSAQHFQTENYDCTKELTYRKSVYMIYMEYTWNLTFYL